jgi:L,D-transpeptidase-like protein
MDPHRGLFTIGLCLLVGMASAHAGVSVSEGTMPAVQEASEAAAMPGLEAALLQAAPTLHPEALHAALSVWGSLKSHGQAVRTFLTVIDYSLPSTTKRMWVFDLASQTLLFHELVAHGRNSGEDMAKSFSNEDGSFMTSLGAFVTGATYTGKNGYSLRLRGIDPGINDRAEVRTIVVHGAPYVSDDFAHSFGRLGRSHGCPAVRTEIARELIDRIKDQTLLYAWHPSLKSSVSPAVVTASATHAGPGPRDDRAHSLP